MIQHKTIKLKLIAKLLVLCIGIFLLSEITYSQYSINSNIIKGGMHSVATIQDRNSIPMERRMLGMLVWVDSEKRMYRMMSPALINSGWVQVNEFVYESNGSATLSSNGDSIRITLTSGTTNGNIIVSWAEEGYLGEIGIRNVTPTGFTIFSNTDEIRNIKVIFLILDYKFNLNP